MVPRKKPVLLVRPHAFIVNEMRPSVLATGYAPHRLEGLAQLDAALASPLRGATFPQSSLRRSKRMPQRSFG